MNFNMQRNMQSGFTLIEVAITVLIIGIIGAVAVPSFNALIRNQAISATTNEIVATLQAARSEAIKRNTSVTVCFKSNPGDNNGGCNVVGSSSSASNNNFIYYFLDLDGSRSMNNAETAMYESLEFNDKVFFTRPSVVVNRVGRTIVFNPKGNVVINNSLARTRAIIGICDDRNSSAAGRAVIINVTGRAQASKITDSLGITC